MGGTQGRGEGWRKKQRAVHRQPFTPICSRGRDILSRDILSRDSRDIRSRDSRDIRSRDILSRDSRDILHIYIYIYIYIYVLSREIGRSTFGAAR